MAERVVNSVGSRSPRGALRHALVALAALTLCIGLVWTLTDRRAREQRIGDRRVQSEQLRGQQLVALETWADDLLTDTRYWAADDVVVASTLQLLDADPDDLASEPALAELRGRLAGFLELNDLQGFFVVAPDGTSLGSSRDSNLGTRNLVVTDHPDAFAEVIDGDVRFTPPQRSDVAINAELQNVETMFAAAPIVVDGDVVAVFMIRVVPTLDLQPVIERTATTDGLGWVVASESGNAVTGFGGIEPLDVLELDGRAAVDVFDTEPVGSNLAVGSRSEVDRIETWEMSPDLGLGVVTLHDGDAAFSDLRSERRSSMLIAALALLIGAALVLAAHQVWEKYRSREQLELIRRRFRALVDPSPDVMIRLRRDGTVLGANEAGEKLLTGDSAATARWEVLENQDGTTIDDVADEHPLLRAIALEWHEAAEVDEPDTIERVHVVIHGDDTYHRVRFVPIIESDGEMLLVVTDVTAFAERELELERLARVDPLTGLGNRLAIAARLDDALLRLDRSSSDSDGVAVMMIDLDHFKPVNDQFGHAAGDAVLIETGAVLRAALRGHDSVGRIGGDEFMIVCERIGGAADAEHVAERIASRLADLVVEVDGVRVEVSGRVGLAWTKEPIDAAELMERADDRLLAAKRDRTGPQYLIAAPDTEIG